MSPGTIKPTAFATFLPDSSGGTPKYQRGIMYYFILRSRRATVAPRVQSSRQSHDDGCTSSLCDTRDRPLSAIQARSSLASPWAISGFRTLSSRDTSRTAAASSGFEAARTNLTASSVDRMMKPGVPRTCSGGLIAYRGIARIITVPRKCSRPRRKAAIAIGSCAFILKACASILFHYHYQGAATAPWHGRPQRGGAWFHRLSYSMREKCCNR
jgi:hypothetical protein